LSASVSLHPPYWQRLDDDDDTGTARAVER